MADADIEGALAKLQADPDDQVQRAQLALALTRAGRHAEAAAALGDGLVNLTAHDGPTLPCLCRRCLRPDLVSAEADGLAFTRRFAVAGGRVLYYWAPSDLADDPGLAQSVASRLSRRLERKRS